MVEVVVVVDVAVSDAIGFIGSVGVSFSGGAGSALGTLVVDVDCTIVGFAVGGDVGLAVVVLVNGGDVGLAVVGFVVGGDVGFTIVGFVVGVYS